ncbi:efflux RND transporter permease subunit [Leptolyngbya sp. 7M]|uniref:efflux RND transporter permease subunit n=1 Tax=Leptolyngbya sp. 7M TaxID=2812896 RepID=UPI001B8AF3BC|nr:efflux RND transporter permease subunit [Leptolyngbya sp. 7M]QYO65514.1 efflux RND transporter permease subunit [Leptolyngbya sp. 7M]
MQWLAEICVHRPVFATVIVLFLTVVGGFSFFTLGVDRFPKIDLPTISVRTSNPGAAPEEIESEITDVVEAALNTVPGVEEMRSSSSRGSSNVTLTFNLEKNPDVAFQEVQQKLSGVIGRLPDSADPPVAQKADPDSQPVLLYVVSAPRTPVELTEQVETLIRERIESADGVGEVFMWGARTPQILVSVNPERLRAYNIAVTDVSAAIRAQNQELPGGNLVEGQRTLGVRTLSKLTEVEQFNELVVATRNGYPIKIRDIGKVEKTGGEPSSAASLDGVQSVSVGIRKQAGANTIAVINNVKQRMENIIPTLPSDMKVAIIRDQSEFIENSLHAIEEHLILGGLFAAIIVFFFLWNFRSTIISALAIPISIIAAFAAIAAFGYSLNQMTMLALTLMVGIVIDDAIVVLENIYRFVEEKGMDPFQAAIEGTREIGLAVLATTLSLLAVFIPVGFMTGIVGRFMSSFGLTAAAAIAVSLIVSFTLTPMLAARWIKKPKHENRVEDEDSGGSTAKAAGESKSGWFWQKIDTAYTFMLRLAMRFRWAVVLICIATVVSIVPLYKFVGMAFLPDEDESLFQVNLRGPQGTSLSATQSILDRIARDIRAEIPGVKNTLVLAGFGRGSGPNNGFINVALVPVSERKESQSDLINRTRQIARKYASKEYSVTVSASSSIAGSIGLGRGGSAVGMYLAGPDMARLNEYANALVERMKQDPIFRDPDNSVEIGTPEIRVVIDRTRAADLGVRAGDVAQALNILAAGQRISTYSEGSKQYDVVVRADEPFRRDRNNFNLFSVASSNGGIIGLDRVVKLEEGLAPSSISRLNRQRQVTVSAGLPPNSSEADALAKLQSYVRDLQMPPEYSSGVTGQSKELEKAYESFMYAFLLSFVFMYLVLAAQFESFIHPVTILLTLPLAVPFALLSTAIAGQTLNIFSALGILLLFGIVKKNAILQIDHTNTLRAQGMSRYDAIIQANRDRLRPILMTTLALVAGMIPLTLGSGAGAATNRSIGILVVGGQSLCLLLTLLAVPVFYSLFDDAGETKIMRRISGSLSSVFSKIFRRDKVRDEFINERTAASVSSTQSGEGGIEPEAAR